MSLIKDQIVKIKWRSNYKEYYVNKGYVFTDYGDDLCVKVDDLYEGSYVLVQVECDYCHKIFQKRYYDCLKSLKTYGDIACKSCIHERTFLERQQNTYNKLLQACQNNGYELVTKKNGITNTNGYIQYNCKKHGLQKMKVGNMLSGKHCPKCQFDRASATYRLDSDEVADRISYCGGVLLNKDNYINQSTKNLKIICPRCGNVFVTSLRLFVQHGGAVCMECYRKESIGELKIKKYLTENNIVFEKEKWFPDCRDKNPLPFDFYIESMNTIIEFDGKQHFYDGKHVFHETYSLDYCIKHDEIKTDYCKEKGIKLIRIPYWDMDKIEEILNKELFT